MRDRTGRLGERLAVAVDQAPEHRARSRDRHLLADDRPDGELEPVHAARHAHAGTAPGQLAQHRVVLELGRDRDRVGIEVEEAAAARHRGGQVAQVVELEDAADGARLGVSATSPPPCSSASERR